SLSDPSRGFFHLFRSRRPQQGLAFQTGIAAGHRDLPRIRMADACAVVHDLAAAPLGVPAVDVLNTDFQLERSGDPVPDMGRVICLGLPVLVQIDESGSHDVSRGIEDTLAGEISFFNGSDLATRYSDGADPVHPGFGIDNTPVQDNQVITALT